MTLYSGKTLEELEALANAATVRQPNGPTLSDLNAFALAVTPECVTALIAHIRELEAPHLPEIRCDKCDNGIEHDWLWCPFCNATLKEEPQT